MPLRDVRSANYFMTDQWHVTPTVNEFVESDPKYRRCFWHVQTTMLIHTPITAIVCLLGIAIGVVALELPHLHHHTPLYDHVLHKYYRRHKHAYLIIYTATASLWIGLHSLHLLTLVLAVIGTQLSRPMLLRPELLLLLVQLGLLLAILISVVTLMILTNQVMPIILTIAISFLLLTCTYTYVVVWCHRYLSDKYRALMEILANTKSVHFKEGKKRRK
uniref:PGG domain-containing protein n=1 Tax=Plectus sambesii TaxID=2011161 RepID=A0A914W6L0_9BILA